MRAGRRSKTRHSEPSRPHRSSSKLSRQPKRSQSVAKAPWPNAGRYSLASRLGFVAAFVTILAVTVDPALRAALAVTVDPALRAARIYFGVDPMGQRLGAIEPWAPGKKPRRFATVTLATQQPAAAPPGTRPGVLGVLPAAGVAAEAPAPASVTPPAKPQHRGEVASASFKPVRFGPAANLTAPANQSSDSKDMSVAQADSQPLRLPRLLARLFGGGSDEEEDAETAAASAKAAANSRTPAVALRHVANLAIAARKGIKPAPPSLAHGGFANRF